MKRLSTLTYLLVSIASLLLMALQPSHVPEAEWSRVGASAQAAERQGMHPTTAGAATRPR